MKQIFCKATDRPTYFCENEILFTIRLLGFLHVTYCSVVLFHLVQAADGASDIHRLNIGRLSVLRIKDPRPTKWIY